MSHRMCVASAEVDEAEGAAEDPSLSTPAAKRPGTPVWARDDKANVCGLDR
jgi:hypothetical protein